MPEHRISIIKHDFTLRVLEDGKIITTYPIAIGQRADGKARIYEEDFRTPEGAFKVTYVQRSGSRWLKGSNSVYYPFYLAHKFGNNFEDLGHGAYGEGIIEITYPTKEDIAAYHRLVESGEIMKDWHNFMEEKWRSVFQHVSETTNVPFEKVVLRNENKTLLFKHISETTDISLDYLIKENEKRPIGRVWLEGKTFEELYKTLPPVPELPMAIHGTNDPECIGHKISGGCVRMFNKDILELIEKFAETGMDVIIEN